MKELDGCFNESADLVKRKDETWSDTNLTKEFTEKDTFKRLKCRNCDGLSFELLSTDSYETSARCNNCGMYYLVHCG
jgi:hypothetical protein